MLRIVFNFFGPPAPAWGALGRALARLCVGVGMACALGGCAWFDEQLRLRVFRATPGMPVGFPGLPAGADSYAVTVPGVRPGTQDRVQIWWLPHARPQAPTLLYLHGTFRNLYQNLHKINALREAGFSVLAVDYRGWGDSTPIIPSEATVYADADTAWAELTRRQPNPRKRVIYGHSMGGGVAVELASRKRHASDYGAQILESTFTRACDVAAASGWLARLVAGLSTQRFDSQSKIGRVDAPVLMLHGDADTTVPVALGRQLRDAAPAGTRWVEIKGGSHSQLASDAPVLYQQALRALLEKLSLGIDVGPLRNPMPDRRRRVQAPMATSTIMTSALDSTASIRGYRPSDFQPQRQQNRRPE